VSGDLSEFHELTELEELRRANSHLQGQLRRAKAKTDDLIEAVYRGALEAALILGPIPPVPAPPPDKRKKREEWALVHATDWQVGKTTKTYNSDIAEYRLAELLPERVVYLTEIQRAARPIRKCALLLGGDMLEGVAIFPGQAFEVDSSVYDQLFRVVHIAKRLIRRLLKDFEVVEVWTEYGNHGRLGRRGDYPGIDNVDAIIYRILAEESFADEPRVRFHLNVDDFGNWAKIGNYTALLVHGDEFKSFGGQTPAYGITRKVTAWLSGVVDPFDDCYIGHFHQAMSLPAPNGHSRAFLTPSPESDNMYAKEFCAATGTPGQRLHFIDPEKGRVTSEHLIWLDE